MTKTKDELIAEFMKLDNDLDNDDPPSSVSYWQDGYTIGSRRMYAHRQKEIDELREQIVANSKAYDDGFKYGELSSEMWWTKRWLELKAAGFIRRNDGETKALVDEMDAAAARVMEK